jgi:mxaJ protein
MRARSLLVFSVVIAIGSARDASATPPAGATVLRVCADPAGLPYSNDKKEGFENRIAELVAKEMSARLEYTWWVQRRGVVRNTLNAGTCDVMMSAPIGLDTLRTTKPYYRSTFAFLTKKGRKLDDLRSFDDPRLRTLRIGIPLAGDDGANPAPAHALGKRGITGSIRGFPLYGDLGRSIPAAAEAVEKDEIDVAILWGPIAGAAAKRSVASLVAVPVAAEKDGELPFAFSIAMGVRKHDAELATKLDAVLERRREAILAILREAGVPLLALSQTKAAKEGSLAPP